MLQEDDYFSNFLKKIFFAISTVVKYAIHIPTIEAITSRGNLVKLKKSFPNIVNVRIIVVIATIKVVTSKNMLGLDLKNERLVLIENNIIISEIVASMNNAVLKEFTGVLKMNSKININVQSKKVLNNPK